VATVWLVNLTGGALLLLYAAVLFLRLAAQPGRSLPAAARNRATAATAAGLGVVVAAAALAPWAQHVAWGENFLGWLSFVVPATATWLIISLWREV